METLLKFINVLCWIYTIAFGGWLSLLVAVTIFTPSAKLRLSAFPIILLMMSTSWIIARNFS